MISRVFSGLIFADFLDTEFSRGLIFVDFVDPSIFAGLIFTIFLPRKLIPAKINHKVVHHKTIFSSNKIRQLADPLKHLKREVPEGGGGERFGMSYKIQCCSFRDL